MAEPLRPAPASTYGRENWLLVLTVASASYVPTAAEVNAAGALDITRIVFADTARPGQTTNRVTQERRLGDTSLAEFIGTTTYQGGEMHYAFSPQGATASDGKKLYEKLTPGLNAFLVQRLAVARAVAPAASQFVNCFPAQFGPSFPLPAGDGESQEAGMVCTFAVTDIPAINVQLT